MTEKRIDKLLKDAASPLGELVRAAADSGSVTRLVIDNLPPDFEAHIVQAGRRDELTLSITVDSAAWGARIRYQAPELLESLRHKGVECDIIAVRIQPRQ